MQNVLSKDTTLQLPTLSGAFHSETCNANGGESDEYTEALQKVCAVCVQRTSDLCLVPFRMSTHLVTAFYFKIFYFMYPVPGCFFFFYFFFFFEKLISKIKKILFFILFLTFYSFSL